MFPSRKKKREVSCSSQILLLSLPINGKNRGEREVGRKVSNVCHFFWLLPGYHHRHMQCFRGWTEVLQNLILSLCLEKGTRKGLWSSEVIQKAPTSMEKCMYSLLSNVLILKTTFNKVITQSPHLLSANWYQILGPRLDEDYLLSSWQRPSEVRTSSSPSDKWETGP